MINGDKDGGTSVRVGFASPLLGASGYATDGRNLLASLVRLPHLVSALRLHPDLDEVALERPLRDIIQQACDVRAADSDVMIVNAPFSEFPTMTHAHRINVRRVVFETTGLPKIWVDECNKHNEIWVASHFNLETFAGAGVDREKIRVMSSPLRPQDYFEGERSIGAGQGFRFLSIFRWQRRKGWDALVSAFLTEFSPSEHVSLTLKIDSFSASGNLDLQPLRNLANSLGYSSTGDNRTMRIITGVMQPRAMRMLYANADCFVLPSRREGWGRPYMEAMASNLPTVALNWGGQLDFMTTSNSYLVDCKEIEVAEPDVIEQPIYANQAWAEPSLSHLRQTMRDIFGGLFSDLDRPLIVAVQGGSYKIDSDVLNKPLDRPNVAQTKGRLAAQEVRAKFSIAACTATLADLLGT